jgi:GntR family transcriptional regulator, transcriptional repressor for pyruvate dehydrogenase complex
VPGQESRSSAFAPIQRAPLYKQILERIQRLVDAGAIVPGDQLPAERELAGQLGVSRTSLRQALTALEALGMIEIRHGAGAYLVATEPEHVVQSLAVTLVEQNERLPESMEARMALERFIAGLAASRRTRPDLERARGALARMEREIAAGEIGTGGDAEFHHALWDAAHNGVLRQLLENLEGQIGRIREESLSQAQRPQRSLAAHWQILEAVEQGDAAGAIAAMDAHLWEVADTLLLKEVRRDRFVAEGESAAASGRRRGRAAGRD